MDSLNKIVLEHLTDKTYRQYVEDRSCPILTTLANQGITEGKALSIGFDPLILDMQDSFEFDVLTKDSGIKTKVEQIYPDHTISWVGNDLVDHCIQMSLGISKKYDVILGLDQYLTFVLGEETQAEHISYILDLLADNGVFLTTTLDYKNTHHSRRTFLDPYLYHATDKSFIFLCYREWDETNRKQWTHYTYVIDQKTGETKLLNLEPRQAIFFKQLAYHANAFGKTNFTVHKNITYKPLYSSEGQFIITIQ